MSFCKNLFLFSYLHDKKCLSMDINFVLMHSSMCFTYVQYILLLNLFIYYLTKSDMFRRILKTNQDLFQFYVIILTFLLYEWYSFKTTTTVIVTK